MKTKSLVVQCTVDKDGIKEWWLNGKLHRKNAPAVEYPDGTKEWWVNNNLHRKDGPAVELEDGSKMWYHNGKLHLEDGPAVKLDDRTQKDGRFMKARLAITLNRYLFLSDCS